MGQFEGNIDGEANSTKEGAIVQSFRPLPWLEGEQALADCWHAFFGDRQSSSSKLARPALDWGLQEILVNLF